MPAETDVLIVGGGITGVTAAYLLAKQSQRVVLLEMGELGQGATTRTTGFLTQMVDTDPGELVKLFEEEKARLIFGAHLDAINGIENIIKAEKIDCDFERCSNVVYAGNSGEGRELFKTAEQLKILGVAADFKTGDGLPFAKFGYLEVAGQAKFDAMKYLTALAECARRYGATFILNTEVTQIDDGEDGMVVRVKNGDTVKAKKVMSATYMPFGHPSRLVHRTNMYRTYVQEYKIPIGSIPSGTYEDDLWPYTYFRTDKRGDSEHMIIGGADHQAVIEEDPEINFRVISEKTKELLGENSFEEVRRWSGLILEPVDGIPFIGEYNGGNIFHAFAFSGNGMTYSYIAAKIFSDQLAARPNPYAELFKTDRHISWRANIFD